MATPSAGTRRTLVRVLYKDLIHAARLLEPAAQRAEALQQIRASFRENLNLGPSSDKMGKMDQDDEEATNARIDALIKEGRDRLGYVRTIVPTVNRRRMKNFGGRYVVDSRTGEVVRGTARGDKRTKWDHDLHFLDPDDVARHNYLLRRQHFLEPPPPHILEKYHKGE